MVDSPSLHTLVVFYDKEFIEKGVLILKIEICTSTRVQDT